MSKINEETIDRILSHLGGADNVAWAGNCMTRLRVTLRNRQLADEAKIRQIDGVLGVVEGDDQLQIVLGSGVAQTGAELLNARLAAARETAAPPAPEVPDLDEIASANKQQFRQKQGQRIRSFLSRFAAIFTPLIPGFIGAGLLLGLATLLDQSLGGPTAAPALASLIAFMKVFSKGLFVFLSILVGYNAQQAFGGSGVNGAIIGSLFVLGYSKTATTGHYAGLSDFFGLVIDPRGNIVGVLIATIVGAHVERWIRKRVSPNLDMILTSLLTLLVMGTLTYLIIMPLGVRLFSGMSWLFLHLGGNPFGTAVLAGLFLLAVVFGVHQGFVPVYVALMESQGMNSLFPVLAMAGAGQVGAAMALYVRAGRDSVLRRQIRGAIVPGFLGVGEPLIYGVTLPRIRPFVTACAGASIGGLFIGTISFLGTPIGLNSVFGPSGLAAIPLMTSHSGVWAGIAIYTIATLITYAAGFVLTWLFGTRNVDLS